MQEYYLKNIEQFEKTIKPFLGLWKSLVIRVGWTRAEDFSIVVFINATLETEEPARIRRPDYSPAAEEFKCAWFIRPAAEISAFLEDLKAGFVQAGEEKLRLGSFQNQKWEERAFSWFRMAPRGQSQYSIAGWPAAYLHDFGSQLDSDTGGKLNAASLKRAWLALPHPYKSMGDVFEGYFQLKSIQGEGMVRIVQAIFPITFSDPAGRSGGPTFKIIAPRTVDLKQLTVGEIITLANGDTERNTVLGTSLAWDGDEETIAAMVKPSRGSGQIHSVHGILRYGDIVLDEQSLESADEHDGSDAELSGNSRSASSAVLSADKPLIDPENDRFGYAPFAKHIAECLNKLTPIDGVVIGLYGPWGSGKSTLLNFLLHYLEQGPKGACPITIQFNPWLFSGHEDLAKKFFHQLLAILRKRDVQVENVRKSIEEFAERVADIPLPWFNPAKWIAKLLHRDAKNIAELKADVEKALREQPRRFLVVIDDIDRLVAEEIRQVFRLVKAVADFPNVTYLLAFDKEVAINAIKDLQHTSGEDYLEKIVQVPFELPRPEKSALRRLLFEKLDEILAETPTGLFDSTHWGNVYFDGIDHFIDTPRDVMRLTNTLRITYSAIKGEVNAADFIAIESIRVFAPGLYEAIRANSEKFTGYRETGGGRQADGLKVFHDAWLAQLKGTEQDALKKLVTRLFPKLESVWGNTFYGAESEKRWRRERRIASASVCPVYFRMAVPEGSISASQMRLLVALASDRQAFGAQLLALSAQRNADGTTKLRTFLENFTDDIEAGDIPEQAVPGAIQAIFDVGDKLMSVPEPRHGMLDFGNEARVGRVLWRLFKRLNKPSRATALSAAIGEGNSPALAVHEVCVLGQQHGKYGGKNDSEDEQLVTADEQAVLEQVALKKVREAARLKRLEWSRELVGVLHRWADWGSLDEPKEWLAGMIAGDAGLAEFLKVLLQKTYSYTVSDSVAKSSLRLNPKWIERFVDLPQLAKRVEALAKTQRLEGDAKLAADRFLLEYGLLQAGKNPDSPFLSQ